MNEYQTRVTALLDPTPLPLETGYERLDTGALHVAVRTDMQRCRGEMLEWWFRWRCDTQKYVWWHPIDHEFSEWQGDLSDDTHVGSEHVVSERMSGLPPLDLLIQFRDPTEFFDAEALNRARNSAAVSGLVLGRIGIGHQPQRNDRDQVLGGRLLHVARDTSWGIALRSHFFLGVDLADAGASPDDVAASTPDQLAAGLVQHCYDEFTFLSKFLPSLYIAEHRDSVTPESPW